MDIRAFKEIFDKQLRKYVLGKIKQTAKIASSTRMQQVIGYVDDFMFSGGKRVRPYLVYLAYKACGGRNDADVIRFAQSHELMQAMALIHDDIMDKGELRHGLPTYHKFVSGLLSSTNKDHIGVSQAILIGDLVFSWIYDVLYSVYTSIPVAQLQAAQRNVQETIEEVIGGQIIDVDIMVGDNVDQSLLEKKNTYKSGKYTFTRPLLTGALLAGAEKKTAQQLEKIGDVLGKAYQMRDDLLDVLTNEGEETSHYDDKTKFSDIQDGQQTYLTQYIYDNGKYAHRLAISRSMGKRLSKSQIEELRQVFKESGAIEYGKQKIEEYLKQAEQMLKKLILPVDSYKQDFSAVIALLRQI